YVDRVWVSERFLGSLDPASSFTVLGGHRGLEERCASSETFDYAVMSYLNPRRSAVLSHLGDFSMAPNAWGHQRAATLSSTRCMLNIHQTDAPVCEPLRF